MSISLNLKPGFFLASSAAAFISASCLAFLFFSVSPTILFKNFLFSIKSLTVF